MVSYEQELVQSEPKSSLETNLGDKSNNQTGLSNMFGYAVHVQYKFGYAVYVQSNSRGPMVL